MLERFIPCDFGQLFQKGEVVYASVADTQRAFAGRTFQLRIDSRPMDLPESAAAQMLFPFRWQPRANWDGIEVCLEINALVLPDARVPLATDASFAACVWSQIDIANRKQRLCDENVSTAEIKVGN